MYALLCCNNLVSSLDVSFLGGLDNLHTVWSGLVKLASSQHGKLSPPMISCHD
jgi:hypothetical protein